MANRKTKVNNKSTHEPEIRAFNFTADNSAFIGKEKGKASKRANLIVDFARVNEKSFRKFQTAKVLREVI